MKSKVSQAASLLGRKGGKVKSTKKKLAARRNAKLPRKKKAAIAISGHEHVWNYQGDVKRCDCGSLRRLR